MPRGTTSHRRVIPEGVGEPLQKTVRWTVFLRRFTKIRRGQSKVLPCEMDSTIFSEGPFKSHLRNQNGNSTQKGAVFVLSAERGLCLEGRPHTDGLFRREWGSLHTKTVRWTVFCRRLTKIRREQSKIAKR